MPYITKLDKIFFSDTHMDQAKIAKIVSETLKDVDDGELFLEHSKSESFVFDDGVLKNANYNTSKGFGLRAILGESSSYAHSSELTEESVKRASKTVKALKSGYTGSVNMDTTPRKTNRHLYTDTNPLECVPFSEKTKLMQDIDSYIRGKNPLVRQVSVSLTGQWQAVEIIRADKSKVGDIRPLVRLNISVMVERNGRMENGSFGTGGREEYANFIRSESWMKNADEALRQALVNLESIPAPAGEMTVALGNGWPGILLHEAIGHGLEGDFNRKKTSAFSSLLGQRIATDEVTVVDDGTLDRRRGSLTIDDEGTPTENTMLIEKGILKGYMQDRMNARLMGMKPTGNGRRESYEYQPMPRMTNTYMLEGKYTHDEIIASIDKGIYAANFGGGQVDITSGKFVFSASEAYLVEKGKIKAPIKGATLIGNGPDVLTKVKMVGNNMKLDPGIGTCGKAGQGVPVGVGQPTILIGGLTVGGTEV